MALSHLDLYCPVCLQQDTIKETTLICKDYTVSQQDFGLADCSHCGHRFTLHPPAEAEIGKYYKSDTYISHSNTQKGIVNRLYHVVRSYSLRRKLAIIQEDTRKTTGKLLDIGSGIGAFLATMKQAGWEVKGLEPDEDARKQSESLHQIVADSPEMLFSLPSQSLDAVTMWHVLEHVHRLHEYLRQIHKILKTDGVFFVAVPNFTSADADFYQAEWAGYDVPRHLHHFSPLSLNYLLAQHGFYIDTLRPMPFDAFYVSLLSEKYRHGRTRLWAGFYRGFQSYWKARNSVQHCSSILYIIRKK